MNTGDTEFLGARQQMMQTVSGFVEKRDYVVVREGCRFVTDRAREIAVEVSDRFLNTTRRAFAGNRLIHPGAAALGFARIEVEIKLANQLAMFFSVLRFDTEEANILMPQ